MTNPNFKFRSEMKASTVASFFSFLVMCSLILLLISCANSIVRTGRLIHICPQLKFSNDCLNHCGCGWCEHTVGDEIVGTCYPSQNFCSGERYLVSECSYLTSAFDMVTEISLPFSLISFIGLAISGHYARKEHLA